MATVHRVIFELCTCCRIFAIQLGDPLPLSHSIPLGLYPPTIGSLSSHHLNAMSLIASVQWSQFCVMHIGSKIVCLESTIHSPMQPDPRTILVSVILFWPLQYIILLLFRVVDEGLITALLRQLFSCRPQHIIQESNWEPIQYLGTHMPQWWVSLFSTVGLHHWPLIGKFHECLTSTHLFTSRWNVLLYLENHRHYWWFLSRLLTVYINDW